MSNIYKLGCRSLGIDIECLPEHHFRTSLEEYEEAAICEVLKCQNKDGNL